MALIPEMDLTKFHPEQFPENLEKANEWGFNLGPAYSQDVDYKYTKKGGFITGKK